MKKSMLYRLGLILCMPMLFWSCDEGTSQLPEDFYDQGNFLVTLDAEKIPGKGQYRTRLESNELLELGVQIDAPSDLEALEITKTVNLEVDPDFGDGGTLIVPISGTEANYTFNYEPSIDDVDQLVGFTFTAVTSDEQRRVSDLTASITLAPLDNLVTKRWRWSSIQHVNSENMPNEEVIAPCEEDNSFLFNADGTMSLDYGPITATGNCGLDGLNVYSNWYISEDGENFIMEKYNVFTPDVIETEVYRIETLSVDQLQLEMEVDLTALGLGIEVFLYTFVPEPIE